MGQQAKEDQAERNSAMVWLLTGAVAWQAWQGSKYKWHSNTRPNQGAEPLMPPAQSSLMAPTPQASSAKQNAKTLFQLQAREWLVILRHTFDEINADRVQAVAAGVTYYGLLALFPALSVLVSVYGLVADRASIGTQIASLTSILPPELTSIISDQVSQITGASSTGLSLALAMGLALAVWSANSGTKAMIDALNIAYEVPERRSFLQLNAQSLAFTLLAVLGVMLLLVATTVVPVVVGALPLGPATDMLLRYGRWPLIWALSILGLAALYRFGPDHPKPKWHWVTPGSFVASLALILFSLGFSWYAANFGHYNQTYGSLGAGIVVLTWMWLSTTIILVGAELNAAIEAYLGGTAKWAAAKPQPIADP